MFIKRLVPVLLLALISGCATTSTKSEAPAPVGSSTLSAEHIAAVQSYTFGQSRELLTQVEDAVQVALASNAESRKLAATLADLLGAGTTADGKLFVCRQLALIGGDAEVAKIAPLLTDPATSDMARYALEPIPGKKADQALINALKSAPAGTTQVGIINSLGNRKVAAAAPALEAIAGGDDDAAAAARNALAKIAG